MPAQVPSAVAIRVAAFLGLATCLLGSVSPLHAASPASATRVALTAASKDQTDATAQAESRTAPEGATAPELVVSSGHVGAINAIAFSADGQLLLTGSDDQSARLWQVSSGLELRRLTKHENHVTAVAFSPDGRRAVTGSLDKVGTRLWDLATGNLLKSYPQADTNTVAFSADGQHLTSGHDDARLIVWNVDDASQAQHLVAQNPLFTPIAQWDPSGDPSTGQSLWSRVTVVAYSPSGDTMAIGGDDTAVVLLNSHTGREFRRLEEDRPAYLVQALAFSPDGSLLLVGGDTVLQLWDVASGQELWHPEADSEIKAVGFSADGLSMAAAGKDKTLRIWDVKTKRLVREITASHQIDSLQFSPDNSHLAVGLDDGELQLLDSRSGQMVWSTNHRSAAYAAVFADDGNSAMIASGYGAALWDLHKGGEMRRIGPQSQTIVAAALSDSGRLIATGDADGTARLWNVRHPDPIAIFNGHQRGITSIAISPDESRVLTGSNDGSARLWDASSGKELRRYLAHGHWYATMGYVNFSPDARQFLLLTQDRPPKVEVFDAATGDLLKSFEPTEGFGSVYGAVFSPRGRYIAVWGYNLQLWDSTTGAIRTLEIPDAESRGLFLRGGGFEYATAAGFSPDEAYVATGCSDGTLRIWEVATGHLLRTIVGHALTVSSVAYSPDGKLLISTSVDGTTRIWKVASSRELASLLSLADGQWLVTDRQGHFDSNRLDAMPGVFWRMPDAPLRPFAPELFMRDYYEPRLLPRVLADRRTDFTARQNLAALNRIQPVVSILSVTGGGVPNEAVVRVSVSPRTDLSAPNGKTSTGVYDLRLFRDGQLVGEFPNPQSERVDPSDLSAWRRASLIRVEPGRTVATHEFHVSLASRNRGKPVVFTAYAFNEDRVKSATVRNADYRVPDAIETPAPRAYVVAIGIDNYRSPLHDLRFAVKDAQAMGSALQGIRGYRVIKLDLLGGRDNPATPERALASKENIHAILQVLARGSRDADARSRLLRAGLSAEVVAELQSATPDDALIVTYAGHGYTADDGTFYLLPSGSWAGEEIGSWSLPHFISSEELSDWLRDVDTGGTTLIIDACHSAASIDEPGFKPGPMGDRGLGQLAYDKGMRILAATQAESSANEHPSLQHGILTYVLVSEGLRADGATAARNGAIGELDWLKFGEQRVPQLYTELASGRFDGRGVRPVSSTTAFKIAAQQPQLFDFQTSRGPGFEIGLLPANPN